MADIKMTTIESQAFIFRYDGTSGTGFLERKKDGFSTARFVCSEGYAEYSDLKRAHTKSRKLFNSICGEYFTPGSTVYNKEDVMGYLTKEGTFAIHPLEEMGYTYDPRVAQAEGK